MTKKVTRVMVTLDLEQANILDSIQGIGTKRGEKIKNILIAYFIEKGHIPKRSYRLGPTIRDILGLEIFNAEEVEILEERGEIAMRKHYEERIKKQALSMAKQGLFNEEDLEFLQLQGYLPTDRRFKTKN